MDLPTTLRVLSDSAELIRLGGYTALAATIFTETGLLFGFFLPGDSLLVTAGLFAATGHLDIVTLLILLCVAAALGDTTGFLIGRSTGPLLFRRADSRIFRRDHLLRSRVFYERHGGKTVILARFVPIARTFVPVLAGVSGMSGSTFALYNVSGALLWVGSMTMTGYLLGRTIPGIDRYIEMVIASVVILSLVPVATEAFRSRKKVVERRRNVRATTRQLATLVRASAWDWTPATLQAITAGIESARRAVAILTPVAEPSSCPSRLDVECGPQVELVIESTGRGMSEAELDLALLEMGALYPVAVDEVARVHGATGSLCDPARTSHCWNVEGAHMALALEDARPEGVRIVMTVSPQRAAESVSAI